ncbi:uncharacterized protein LOC108910547 [Anoplophora glabripennis]|uniref:uncharacterized protein LOC108910547 n=1 Tax=Anoplophora glabripennis TaxID=217634 RepID=UPI000874DA04|nr:uncharacterized protein LOC108910547 [Anoplophora glabripennis]XP_018570692.1 uncharacterized protein LOC108910547 [Anoplophora glabripennis]
MAKSSRSMVEYLVSALQSVLEAKAIGRSFPTGPWERTAPIAKALASVVPKIVEDWKEIEKLFLQRWNFPRCCGTIDGKHVVIKRPPCSGSLYYNYKKIIILFAMVDADYCFTCRRKWPSK